MCCLIVDMALETVMVQMSSRPPAWNPCAFRHRAGLFFAASISRYVVLVRVCAAGQHFLIFGPLFRCVWAIHFYIPLSLFISFSSSSSSSFSFSFFLPLSSSFPCSQLTFNRPFHPLTLSASSVYFLSHFLQFLGSAVVVQPKVRASLELALFKLLQSKKTPRAGTISVSSQGIKWVKQGQVTGALYGIHRVLFAMAHDQGPYFSFVVQDKVQPRYICHCFVCGNEVGHWRVLTCASLLLIPNVILPSGGGVYHILIFFFADRG